MIAEEIISGYLRIRDFLKDARNQYLKDKTKQQKSVIRQSAGAFTRPASSKADIEINRSMKKIYNRFVDKVHLG